MPTASPSALMDRFRRAVLGRDGAGLTDGQLLDRFLRERDETAFAALVRRHGPMVLAVCRRVLRHDQDAEDAFQATFIVLVRKASAIGRRELLGNWLYGVAYRTALEARSVASRRRTKECSLEEAPEPPAREAEVGDGSEALLDAELSRLPDKYRVPLLLCLLQGRNRQEAAKELGLAEGTLSSRLATGRKLLAERLSRRGLVLPASGVAAFLSGGAAAARVPANLIDLTLTAASAAGSAEWGAAAAGSALLAEGVLRAMLFQKVKAFALAAVAACTLFAVGGLFLTGQPALADKPNAAKPDKPKPDGGAKPAKPDKPKPDGNAKPAKPNKPEAGPSVQGTVQSLDPAKKTITVTVVVDAKNKKTEDQTFAVGDAKVLLEDLIVKDKNRPLPEGKLADLAEGTGVSLQLTPDRKAVVSIRARGPAVQGRIQSADATKNTFTLLTKSKDGPKEYVVELAKEAKVLIDDGLGDKKTPPKEGKFADLAEGTSVSVQLTVDRKKALGVRVFGPSLHGRLKGYDAGNRTLTVTIKEDGQIVDKSFTLAKQAKIEGEPTAGAKVQVRLSAQDPTIAVGVWVQND